MLSVSSCAHAPESAAYYKELYEDCKEQAAAIRLTLSSCEKEYRSCVEDLYNLRVTCGH